MSFRPKLTPQQKEEIKNAPKYYRAELLAKIYKVSSATISKIRKGK
jgi:hypothetical protein